MWPRRSNWCWKHQDAIEPMSFTNRDCSAITVCPIYPAIWLNGLKARAWIMFGVRHTTHKLRARSNAGTKHSRIECCLRITFYRVISRCRSATSSIITIITATMRVSTISRPQIPTSGVMLRYRKEEKDQETDHPKTPLEPSTQSGLTSNQDEPDPLLQSRLGRPKCFDDGH